MPKNLILLLAVTLMPLAAAAQSGRPSVPEVYFRLDHPCPATGQTHGACKGYVIDRIIPLACGGADEPDNMQWQTIAEAKEKSKWERIGCRPGRKLVLPGQSTYDTEAYALRESPPPVEVQPLPIEADAPQ